MSDANEVPRSDPALPPEEFQASDDHLQEGTDLGSIQIHNNVIAVIARKTATAIPGVADLTGSIADDLAGIFGKKTDDRGIRVLVEENTVAIDLHVVIDFGVKIPQVSWQLQNEVREAVEQMTGKHVTAVNVIVQGVRMPSDGDAGGESAGS